MAATRPAGSTRQRAEAALTAALEEPGIFDDLPETSKAIATVAKASIVPEESAYDQLKSLDNKLYERSYDVVMGVMDFGELADDATEPPAEWTDAMGYDAALKRFRLARAGGMGSKEAPVAIKTATALVAAAIKARAMEKAGPRALAIQFVQMSAPLPDFPRRIVETNEK